MLAGGPIRRDLQAHQAAARVAEQPPPVDGRLAVGPDDVGSHAVDPEEPSRDCRSSSAPEATVGRSLMPAFSAEQQRGR